MKLSMIDQIKMSNGMIEEVKREEDSDCGIKDLMEAVSRKELEEMDQQFDVFLINRMILVQIL